MLLALPTLLLVTTLVLLACFIFICLALLSSSYPPVSYLFLFITVYAYIPYILKGVLYYRME